MASTLVLCSPRAGFSLDEPSDASTLVSPLSSNGILVEARVTSVQAIKQRVIGKEVIWLYIGTMRISHVYSGSQDLKGADFTAHSNSTPPLGTSSLRIVPQLKVGEVGLWLLHRQPGGELHPCGDGYFPPHAWPVRKGLSPRYDEATKLAQAIEKVEKASTRSDRLKLTKDFTTDPIAGISMWAVASLGRIEWGEWTFEETADFLDGLLKDKRLTIAGQVALDNALLNVRNFGWQTSPERLQFLEKWVTARLDLEDANRVRGQIDFIAQHPRFMGLEIEELLALIKTAVNNEGFPVVTRVRMVGTVNSWMPARARRYTDDAPAFEFLVDVVKHGKVPELQLRAATGLSAFFATDGERRRAIVMDLQGAAKDNELATALEEALRPPGTR